MFMCDPPRIYPSLPEYTPLFNKFISTTLPESTPPSQNIPLFSATVYDPSRINLSLPEYTPRFNKCLGNRLLYWFVLPCTFHVT